MVVKNQKISFCTVCMNRLAHLKQTLPQNLLDNEDYEEVEFILLDYNSRDDMIDWVNLNFHQEIQSGKIKYFKIENVITWNPSHSKNVAFKLATGDIVCNLWADYYTGKGFAKHVNEIFQGGQSRVLTPIEFPKSADRPSPAKDVLGKVCVRKKDFLSVRGFDERMKKHGFEDYDFVNRLMQMGAERVLIDEPEFLKFLSHPDEERFQLPFNLLTGAFIRHIVPGCSEILLLFKNFRYKQAFLKDENAILAENPISAYNKKKKLFDFSLDAPWRVGNWAIAAKTSSPPKHDHAIENKPSKFFNFSGETVTDIDSGFSYNKLSSASELEELLIFDHFYDTRYLMEENIAFKRIAVNTNLFGDALAIRIPEATQQTYEN